MPGQITVSAQAAGATVIAEVMKRAATCHLRVIKIAIQKQRSPIVFQKNILFNYIQ